MPMRSRTANLWSFGKSSRMRIRDESATRRLNRHRRTRSKIYENGLLTNILRSGGFLLAETDPRTNNVIALHLVMLESGGAQKDEVSECHGVVKLADAEKLVKDTAEFVELIYSSPSTEDSSLASRYYGGTFPHGDQFQEICSQSLIPFKNWGLTRTRSEKRPRSMGVITSGHGAMHFQCQFTPPVQSRR